MRRLWSLGWLLPVVLAIASTPVAGSIADIRAALFPYPALKVSVNAVSKVVAVTDMNHDGIDDVVVSGHGVVVFLGRGDGSFESRQVNYYGGTELAIADFDLDGNQDIASVNAVALGSGDGSWTVVHPLVFDGSAAQMVAGDFNGDHLPDLAIVRSDGSLIFLPGRGDGRF